MTSPDIELSMGFGGPELSNSRVKQLTKIVDNMMKEGVISSLSREDIHGASILLGLMSRSIKGGYYDNDDEALMVTRGLIGLLQERMEKLPGYTPFSGGNERRGTTRSVLPSK